MAGATPAAYNGTYTITVVDANSFTYVFAGGTSPATGTITATGPETSEDVVLSRLADGATALIERYTRRKFVTRTLTEIRDGDGSKLLWLREIPVVTFTSLTVLRSPTDATAETVSADDYEVNKAIGKVWLHSDQLNKGVGNVTAVYTAGLGTQDAAALPQDVMAAGLELVKLLYTEKDAGMVAAQSINIGPHTFMLRPEWPKQIKQTLDDWRRPL